MVPVFRWKEINRTKRVSLFFVQSEKPPLQNRFQQDTFILIVAILFYLPVSELLSSVDAFVCELVHTKAKASPQYTHSTKEPLPAL